MSTSGALTGYYVDSLILPENEETRFSSGSALIPHTRPSVIPTDHTELGPCTFPSKQPVYGGSGWGHIQTHFSSGVPPVYQPHTQPPVVGDYVQSWLLDSACGLPLTEPPVVHNTYHSKPDTHRTNYDGAQATSHGVPSSGDSGCPTETVSGQAPERDSEIEEKPVIDPGKVPQNYFLP